MSIRCKKGVKLEELQPKVLRDAVLVIEPQFARLGFDAVITSTATDGKHGPKSRHYLGFALDLRIWKVRNRKTIRMTPAQLHRLAGVLRQKLPPGYDVVIEKTHLHIEFDPTYADIVSPLQTV